MSTAPTPSFIATGSVTASVDITTSSLFTVTSGSVTTLKLERNNIAYGYRLTLSNPASSNAFLDAGSNVDSDSTINAATLGLGYAGAYTTIDAYGNMKAKANQGWLLYGAVTGGDNVVFLKGASTGTGSLFSARISGSTNVFDYSYVGGGVYQLTVTGSVVTLGTASIDNTLYVSGGYVSVGTTNIGAGVTPTSNFGTNKEIYANGGFNVGNPNALSYVKTGMYAGSSNLAFWSGNGQIVTMTYVGGTGTSADSLKIAESYNASSGTGTVSTLRIIGSTQPAGANSVNYNQIYITPAYSQSIGTGAIRGIYYNPTITTLGSSTHTAIETTSGNIIFGGIPTSSISGIGVLLISSSGQLYYTASSAFIGLTSAGGSTNQIQYNVSNVLTAESSFTYEQNYHNFQQGYQVTASGGSYSHAQGFQTIASGGYSHTEGRVNTAYAVYSHAEGQETSTLFGAEASHTEGFRTITIGQASHAEGNASTAYGNNSHAEGFQTVASGSSSHAEGISTIASGGTSHAEGSGTLASGSSSHAEGQNTVAWGDYSHAAGTGTIASGSGQNVVGSYNKQGDSTSLFIIGNGTSAGARSDVFKATTTGIQVTGSVIITGSLSNGTGGTVSSTGHVEGTGSQALGSYSHAEGTFTIVSAGGTNAHAEGDRTLANADSCHVEGYLTTGSGQYAHAEGRFTQAYYAAHSEGTQTVASGTYSHAEGINTIAYGLASHAEGNSNFAYGDYCHAEGQSTRAYGTGSHAEGYQTETWVGTTGAHTEGYKTVASGSYQTVMGTWNKQGDTSSLFIIGNGTSEGARSDVFRATTTGIQVTGSATITDVLVLPYQNPLPSSKPTGSIATSGSGATFIGLFLYNGTSWVKLSV